MTVPQPETTPEKGENELPAHSELSRIDTADADEGKLSQTPASGARGPENGEKASAQPTRSIILEQFSHSELLKILTSHTSETGSDYSRRLQLWTEENAEKFLREEKASGSLATRWTQAALHLNLTEHRISKLERSLIQLDAIVKNLPPDFSLDKPKKRYVCSYQPILKRCTRNEFDLYLPHGLRERVPLSDRIEWPALEALMPQSSQISDSDTTHMAMPQVPERLRIRYQPLLDHVQTITGEDIGLDITNESGMVFLRPFKLFVQYEDEIRNSLPALQESILQAKRTPAGQHQTPRAKLMSEGEGLCKGRDFKYDDLVSQLKLLVEFMDIDLKPVFKIRREILDGTLNQVEYGDLWHLFQRGDNVVSRADPTQIFRVINFTGGREPLASQWKDYDAPSEALEGFVVDCISVIFNGKQLVPRLTKLQIPWFQGSRPIPSLDVYPLRFSPEKDALEKDAVENGIAYLDVVSKPFCHMLLKGTTTDDRPQDVDAQIIIDTTLATNTVDEWRMPATIIPEKDLTLPDHRETTSRPNCLHGTYTLPGCCGSDRVFEDLKMDFRHRDSHVRSTSVLNPKTLVDLPYEDRILLPNWVHGFVLRTRQWVTARVKDLHPVQFPNDFDQLILPDDHKRTLKALVEIHENARDKETQSPVTAGIELDLVKGKGTGLIILLHGEPGVGKTSTAECIADTTKRPLFPITCGDIGETPLEVEKNLHSNFSMAQKWGCVLLLDEADVFLAKRTQTDIRQNAVTSVFLRSLEYYGGILFLTTNRVGGIDPAFKSRVHMALLYPTLDYEATKKLYSVFIKRTRDEQQRAGVTRFTIDRKDILKFAKQHYKRLYKEKREGISTWNGRYGLCISLASPSHAPSRHIWTLRFDPIPLTRARQIRNAFQTAIALVEHDALHHKHGDSKPVLSGAQFEIVAEASRQFDEYIIRAVGMGETAMAVWDQWRADPRSVQATNTKRKSAMAAMSVVSEDDDASDSISEESSEEGDSDEDGFEHHPRKGEGKTGSKSGSKRGKASTSAAEKDDSGSEDEALLRAIRKIRALEKKGRKGK